MVAEFLAWRDAAWSLLVDAGLAGGFRCSWHVAGSGSLYLAFAHASRGSVYVRLSDHRSRHYRPDPPRGVFSVRWGADGQLWCLVDKLARVGAEGSRGAPPVPRPSQGTDPGRSGGVPLAGVLVSARNAPLLRFEASSPPDGCLAMVARLGGS